MVSTFFTALVSLSLIAMSQWEVKASDDEISGNWRTAQPGVTGYQPVYPAFQFTKHLWFTCPQWAVEKQGSFDLTVDDKTYHFSITDSLHFIATGRYFKIQQRSGSPNSGPACTWRTLNEDSLIGTEVRIDATNVNNNPKLAVQFKERRMFKLEHIEDNFSCGTNSYIAFHIDREIQSSNDRRQINLLDSSTSFTFGQTIHVEYLGECDRPNKYPSAYVTILQ